MRGETIEIPSRWRALEAKAPDGLVMVLGATDTGKSTLVRYLAERWGEGVARLDGDPGQGQLGPPATMTLEIPGAGGVRRRRAFVGDITPSGHMLPLLVGAARLVRAAQEAGVQAVLYDTTGLVDPRQGGAQLKWSKIDLLRPSILIALQHERELEVILEPLQRRGWPRIIRLAPAMAARKRSLEERRRNRQDAFRRYFEGAATLSLDLKTMAVFPAGGLLPGRLIALEDEEGWLLGLGRVEDWDEPGRWLRILSPVPSPDGIRCLRAGDLLFEGQGFRHRRQTARLA